MSLAPQGRSGGYLTVESRVREHVPPAKPRTSAVCCRRVRQSVIRFPVHFDAEDYKSRSVVERAFSHIKDWRGLATRYDTCAITYRGAVVLASTGLWLRA